VPSADSGQPRTLDEGPPVGSRMDPRPCGFPRDPDAARKLKKPLYARRRDRLRLRVPAGSGSDEASARHRTRAQEGRPCARGI